MDSEKNKSLENDIRELLRVGKFEPSMVEKYSARLEEGKLTKEENPQSHFCVYFAAYDPEAKEIYMGHHKKSGLWLFNGGHIDAGETIGDALVREINEEWGLMVSDFEIKDPELLTITEIDNPTKQPCRYHFDIWHFIPVKKDTFWPDPKKLAEEFHEIYWQKPEEAKKITIDPNTIRGIEFITDKLFAN